MRETRRNPKIPLATSQMDKMAPENVTTPGTLKLDERREADSKRNFKRGANTLT